MGVEDEISSWLEALSKGIWNGHPNGLFGYALLCLSLVALTLRECCVSLRYIKEERRRARLAKDAEAKRQ
jgi:hypothetical protein